MSVPCAASAAAQRKPCFGRVPTTRGNPCRVLCPTDGRPSFCPQPHTDAAPATSPLSLQAYGTCHSTSARRHLLDDTTSASSAKQRLGRLAANIMVLSFVGSLALGIFFVSTLKRNAQLWVKMSCIAQVVAPLVMALGLFGSGQPVAGAVLLVFSALAALALYLWRAQLAMVARLLTVSSTALAANPQLVSVTIGISILSVAYAVPIVLFIIAATRVGGVVPSPMVAKFAASDSTSAPVCLDSNSSAIACCAWQVAPAAGAYIALAGLSLSWMTALAYEVRTFSISYVVTKWFYTPLGAAVEGKPVREALTIATGPSFGSLCLGSAILTVANAARSAADNRRQRGENLLSCLMSTLLACVADLLKLMTRFATVRIAATGEAFFDGARQVISLLSRNALNTYAVWSFPSTILAFTALAIGLCWAAFVGLIYAAVGSAMVSSAPQDAQSDASSTLSGLTAAVAGGSFALAIVIVSFLSSILMTVIDACYVCYASDLDAASVSQPEVHAVFASVPNVRPGNLVQQPDGELGYAPGAPPPR